VCGWWGSSGLLHGGTAIADTGDHEDCYCPICGKVDPDERIEKPTTEQSKPIDVEGVKYELWKAFQNHAISVDDKGPDGFTLNINDCDMEEAIDEALSHFTPVKVEKGVTDCPFLTCSLNSGKGHCVSTNKVQCTEIPPQFKED
jgi:hypothetical protein